MFLRDFGLSADAGATRITRARRSTRYWLQTRVCRFVLIGDTGQKDAFVYRDAIARHPGRIEHVILREPVVGAPQASLDAIAEIEATGVPVHHASDFKGAGGARRAGQTALRKVDLADRPPCGGRGERPREDIA